MAILSLLFVVGKRKRKETGTRDNSLLQLSLGLLVRSARRAWDCDVGGAVENVLAVERTLPKRRPPFGVVVVHVGRVDGRRGDVVLESPEVGKHLGDSRRAKLVDYLSIKIMRISNAQLASYRVASLI